MPWDKTKYPANWDVIVATVRQRSGDRCECHGQCGLHAGDRCAEINHQPALWEKDRIIRTTELRGTVHHPNTRVHLTTAHLCSCDPPCGNLPHLIHACQRCHLRIDTQLHLRHRRERRERETGQRRIFAR